jgi:hypothetical protein
MSFVPINEALFDLKLCECLEQTRKILRNEKGLTTLHEVAHKYGDKYRLADYMGMSAIACYLKCLSALGLSSGDFLKLVSWSQCLDVTLCLEVQEECVFVKQAEREAEISNELQTVTVGVLGYSMTSSKVITTVTDYYYLFAARYELVAYRGVGDSATDRIVLQSRSSEQEIVTESETCPYASAAKNHFDLNISWLLRRIDSQSTRVTFSIDRKRDNCHTPSNNEDIAAALAFFSKCGEWSYKVLSCHDKLFRVQQTYSKNHVKQDLTAIRSDGLFMPVLPFVSDNESRHTVGEEQIDGGANSITSSDLPVTMTDALVNQLLSEHGRSLQAKLDSLITLFPPSTSKAIITVAEAKLLVIVVHMTDIVQNLVLGIGYVENMLRNQIVAAVGKTLQLSDFAAYLRHHNRKLFKEEFQLRPFSHAVRRTAQHSPEGSIRIETESCSSLSEPIYTSCCSRSEENAAPMQFALDASTNVTFGGDRHLHTYLAHSFSGQALPILKLVAQARQFSSFIVLVGRIVSATEFVPEYGMIVQNKEEISISLDLEQIPSPKQFKDAIESLSPEQQRFAKAFRGMQLASTLFGVLVLQIKPQLEIVLKLSTDTLTKEIKLTQDLMMMFIKYQIPSDLLSFDQVSSSFSPNQELDRLNAVKEHVTEMKKMLSLSKVEEVVEQKLKYEAHAGFLGFGSPGSNTPFGSAAKSTGALGFGGSGSFGSAAQSTGALGLGGSGTFGSAAQSTGALGFGGSGTFGSAAQSTGALGFGGSGTFGSAAQSTGSGPVMFGSSKASPLGHESIAEIVGNISSESSVRKEGGNAVINRFTDADYNDASDNVSRAAQDHSDGGIVDYTKFPSLLDRRYEQLDSDSVLRPAIIHPGRVWTKKHFKSLMAEAEIKTLHTDDQVLEKNAAFDLLDALSKSGALVMHSASLHVVIAATHCFDKSLMDTVVQGNVNPIERVERSALIMASTIHELPACDLISENQRSRVLTYSPQLEGRI